MLVGLMIYLFLLVVVGLIMSPIIFLGGVVLGALCESLRVNRRKMLVLLLAFTASSLVCSLVVAFKLFCNLTGRSSL
jgi:hypothetical protein